MVLKGKSFAAWDVGCGMFDGRVLERRDLYDTLSIFKSPFWVELLQQSLSRIIKVEWLGRIYHNYECVSIYYSIAYSTGCIVRKTL